MSTPFKQKKIPQTKKASARSFSVAGKNMVWVLLFLAFCFFIYSLVRNVVQSTPLIVKGDSVQTNAVSTVPVVPTIDKMSYNRKLIELANNPLKRIVTTASTATSAVASMGTASPSVQFAVLATPAVPAPTLWPATTVYPNVGALLPFNRIIAYYGNFYSKGMGVLGQYPPDEVLAKLKEVCSEWQAADPTTPVIPAIDYIAISAQGYAGSDGKYRDRMPSSQIDQAISMAGQINGITILDTQMGQSTVETEIPLLEPYLKLPNVELALDPEFSMKPGQKPGTIIGSMDASDINYVISYLSKIVDENNLTPKILVVHRFTDKMVTNYREIKPTPEVQVVMDMDGWGPPGFKTSTYKDVIYNDPVQFTGFKLFYINDLKKGSSMLTPEQVLKLEPQPSFIQYQ